MQNPAAEDLKEINGRLCDRKESLCTQDLIGGEKLRSASRRPLPTATGPGHSPVSIPHLGVLASVLPTVLLPTEAKNSYT